MGSRTELRRLEIVPIGSRPPDKEMIRAVRQGIERSLRLDVHLGEPIVLDLDAQQPTDSGSLVDLIIQDPSRDDRHWHLGITSADLDAPGRRWVYGEATQGGRWAIVSVARFGAPDGSSPRLRERAVKEALHEIGHLAGLDHCETPGCIMTKAGTVAAIDSKNSKFCSPCLTRLGELGRT